MVRGGQPNDLAGIVFNALGAQAFLDKSRREELAEERS
jgi:hypothetical protein